MKAKPKTTQPQRPAKRKKPRENQKAQSERFLQAAREHECELDEAAFDETLKRVFPPKTVQK